MNKNPNLGGVTGSHGFEGGPNAPSTSCSPPSVTDLTTLTPQDHHFDPDFDVVDDMKFIDSLIRTIPNETDQAHHAGQHSDHSSYQNSNKRYLMK